MICTNCSLSLLFEDEKRAKAIKKGIEGMGSIWRKRKRQCIEFVSNMEDATEGTISLKKCLKGDGPIDIDSDEASEAARRHRHDFRAFCSLTFLLFALRDRPPSSAPWRSPRGRDRG